MSRIQVESYLSRIDQLRRVSGATNEVIVSQAFARLLEDWATDQKLIFVQQHAYETPQKTFVRPDGVVLHDIRVPLGWWEAKDTSDDLEKEIEKKLRKGYPQDNIVFENGATAILYQNRHEAFRCDMTDPAALEKLVTLFFGYERPEIAEFRTAVRQFGTDLPAILEGLRAKIAEAYADNPAFGTQAAAFLTHARQTINPGLTEEDVREMLIQHVLTEEIFTQVFNDGQYHRENNIARELTKLEDAFFTGAVKRDTLRAMQPYYQAIKANAAQISLHSEKQTFLKLIYEQFYKVYNPKAADRLGVVYTPNEIVRFMIEGADWLCEKHFGKTLIEPGVEILDPATGTGTFICELIEHFRGQPKALHRKYKEELHANEVAILPYYVANLNIEATYAAVAGQYAEFPNLCFVDTLDNVAGLGVRKGTTPDLFGALSDENVARVKRQNMRKISVVIGNPPYNAWQENFNQRNANRSYKKIDQRIKETYILKGSAQNQNSVYDMYTRFFRWSADRVHDDGIIAFIVGRKPVAKGAYDGFRRDLADEFNEVYVVDLGGDAIDNPKLSGTRHNVFGNRSGVAIYFLVKKHRAQGCKVFYARRDEYDTKQDKLSWLGSTPMAQVKFDRITPDKKGNWLGQTENDWEELLPLVSKDVKAGKRGAEKGAIFKLFSRGLGSYRDEWVYDSNRTGLEAKMRYMVETYEATRADPEFTDRNTIKWDAELDRYAKSNIKKQFDPTLIRRAEFRPFSTLWLYLDQHFNGRTYQLPVMFPPGAENPAISFSDPSAQKPWMTISTSGVPDLHLVGPAAAAMVASRYRFTPTGERVDNITDWALKTFTDRYGKSAGVSRDTIFAYVYAALHDPLWRETYAINLKREFPRIPLHPQFGLWAGWGQRLLDLHIGYEGVAPWPLTRRDVEDAKSRAAGVSPRVILKSD
ncbi:MAG: type ISP restriction/modification enzyme, partial [Tabrizicola sp.]|nr:type ISP restriction/modification enzyme [Tabrizicola sp.]